jgi:hypothetical protein
MSSFLSDSTRFACKSPHLERIHQERDRLAGYVEELQRVGILTDAETSQFLDLVFERATRREREAADA